MPPSRDTRSPRHDSADAPAFVIQQHAASTVHYDFRLEVEGVLKSWAIPKGPSTDPREKRLALPTPDHALPYADFEGVIPEEEYGGGTVLIWDRGHYRPLATGDARPRPVARQIEEGHVTLWLEGEEISGGYALIRTGLQGNGWLLIKMDDDRADARRHPVATEPRSVKSGRTLQEVRDHDAG
ncbi:DNA polymerase ligase N-terminal domain-containing protein [Halomonas sp. NO4]|uniref:DNA polymerase ligase N-terminal domain-containing protein n=1 Tax=Halomonas sp. NO4 TaxID=2484813 RepID=UPI0013D47868|nr:DNA polymerase ligase N-terminal domain-containing protein [Halomonas sp. NO4]